MLRNKESCRNNETFQQHPKNPNICIVGAGITGLCAAIKLKSKLGIDTFQIFDTNDDVGGTWMVNKYPGCECDVPIHLYSYSFHPKSDWKARYATQSEILEYLQSATRKYGIYNHLKLKHLVKRLEWMHKINSWNVTVHDLSSGFETELIFDLVICATGLLRYPNIPEIFNEFKGIKMHSAQWDPNVNLEGKKVAIIGSGTSAVQIIPAIVGKVERLFAYQRSPPWVYPRFKHKYPKWAQWAFENVPGFRKTYRFRQFTSLEIPYSVFRTDTIASHLIRPVVIGVGKAFLRLKVKDQALREKLRPTQLLGCKRPCIKSNYYTTLCKENVDVIREPITKVTERSIVTQDGREEPIDVLILATGFRIQDYFAPMEIIGVDSVNIYRKWKDDRPHHYKSMTSYDMPNLFNLVGPGADVGHNSLVFMAECQVRWMLKVIGEMVKRKAQMFCVKQQVQDEYMKRLDKRVGNTIWAHPGCHSIYSNEKGIVTIKHYDNLISHWKKLRNPKLNHFIFC